MDLEIVGLSDVSQIVKDGCLAMLLVRGDKRKGANAFVFRTEIRVQDGKSKLMLPRIRGEG